MPSCCPLSTPSTPSLKESSLFRCFLQPSPNLSAHSPNLLHTLLQPPPQALSPISSILLHTVPYPCFDLTTPSQNFLHTDRLSHLSHPRQTPSQPLLALLHNLLLRHLRDLLSLQGILVTVRNEHPIARISAERFDWLRGRTQAEKVRKLKSRSCDRILMSVDRANTMATGIAACFGLVSLATGVYMHEHLRIRHQVPLALPLFQSIALPMTVVRPTTSF